MLKLMFITFLVQWALGFIIVYHANDDNDWDRYAEALLELTGSKALAIIIGVLTMFEFSMVIVPESMIRGFSMLLHQEES